MLCRFLVAGIEEGIGNDSDEKDDALHEVLGRVGHVHDRHGVQHGPDQQRADDHTPHASAAAGQVTPKPDLTFAAVWQAGATSYPITYQSWDLVYAKQPNANDAAMLKAYLGYLLGDGQKLLPQLGYAPLPANLDQQAQAQLSKITS